MKIKSLMLPITLRVYVALIFSTTIISCNKEKGALPTISQFVVGLKDLSQLEASAIKADLVIALSNKNNASGSDGNFTVFAPTNQAFQKIGLANPQDLNALQTPFLISVLKYHLSNGSTKDEMLPNTSTLNSLLGEDIKKTIVIRDGEKYVNGSKIIVADTKTDNGVVHVINRVLLASGTDIANTAIFFAQGKGFINPELSFLVEAVHYCDLVDDLANPNSNYTVFAPTDQAFKDLGKILGVSIEKPVDIRKLYKATVTQVLLNHIVSNGGGKFTSQLYTGNLQALSGKNIILGEYINGLLSVKGSGNSIAANMVIPDIQTTNGIVHVIDRVLLP